MSIVFGDIFRDTVMKLCNIINTKYLRYEYKILKPVIIYNTITIRDLLIRNYNCITMEYSRLKIVNLQQFFNI